MCMKWIWLHSALSTLYLTLWQERDPQVSLFDESSASFSPSQANDVRRLLELSHNGYRAHSRIMQTSAASHSMIYSTSIRIPEPPRCYRGNNKHSDRDFRPKLRVMLWVGGGSLTRATHGGSVVVKVITTGQQNYRPRVKFGNNVTWNSWSRTVVSAVSSGGTEHTALLQAACES